MFSSLPATVQQEITDLSRQYGEPLVRTFRYDNDGDFEPLNKTDRYAEACMVIRRPNGKLLTMIKTYYPPDAYRLLTGGIDHGESILHGLLRETTEETGLQVDINRFLAIAAYHLPRKSDDAVFYTFAFLLDEISGTLGMIDASEQVGEFREITVDELPLLAHNLAHLGDDNPAGDWPDWGQFRAAIHELVWDALQTPGA